MAGSERKKKLKGLFWQCSHLKQLTEIYSTTLQLILDRLWAEFPDNKKINKYDFLDYNHYELLISCFNRDFREKQQHTLDLVSDFESAASEEKYSQNDIEKEMLRILSGGKGLNNKITSNKKRGKRRARINSSYKLFISISKSTKKMTDEQEWSTCIFTDQIKDYFLNKI